ncbi:MAG: DUF3168 domain-containing protein [Vicinamibacterales bacterium]
MSAVVDAALVALLQADATLAGLAPGGVYPEMAPEQNSTPYVVVILETHEDVQEENRPAYEQATYLVVAIDKADDAAAANAAYGQVHAALTAATLAPSGYHTMDLVRTGRMRQAERDGSVIWRYVGGRYRWQGHPV